MPDIKYDYVMFNTIDNAIKCAKFSGSSCMTYSSDNTNLMFEKKNNLLTKVKNA